MSDAKKPRSKSALPGASRLNAFSVDPTALTIVGLDTDDGPSHPLYDERINLPLDEGLVRNVRAYGVMEPVLARKNGETVEVVDGRQRVRAAREASKRMAEEGYAPIRVPVMLRRDKDERALGVMISTNENRTSDNPVIRARKAQRMIDYGQPEEDIAIAFGVSKKAVTNLLKLLDLDDSVQDMVAAQMLAMTSALTLRDLSRDEQREQAKVLMENGVTREDAARQARERKARKNGKNVADGGAPRGRSVKVAVLRKHVEDESFMGGLEPQAQDMLRWILGDKGAGERLGVEHD